MCACGSHPQSGYRTFLIHPSSLMPLSSLTTLSHNGPLRAQEPGLPRPLCPGGSHRPRRRGFEGTGAIVLSSIYLVLWDAPHRRLGPRGLANFTSDHVCKEPFGNTPSTHRHASHIRRLSGSGHSRSSSCDASNSCPQQPMSARHQGPCLPPWHLPSLPSCTGPLPTQESTSGRTRIKKEVRVGGLRNSSPIFTTDCVTSYLLPLANVTICSEYCWGTGSLTSPGVSKPPTVLHLHSAALPPAWGTATPTLPGLCPLQPSGSQSDVTQT